MKRSKKRINNKKKGGSKRKFNNLNKPTIKRRKLNFYEKRIPININFFELRINSKFKNHFKFRYKAENDKKSLQNIINERSTNPHDIIFEKMVVQKTYNNIRKKSLKNIIEDIFGELTLNEYNRWVLSDGMPLAVIIENSYNNTWMTPNNNRTKYKVFQLYNDRVEWKTSENKRTQAMARETVYNWICGIDGAICPEQVNIYFYILPESLNNMSSGQKENYLTNIANYFIEQKKGGIVF